MVSAKKGKPVHIDILKTQIAMLARASAVELWTGPSDFQVKGRLLKFGPSRPLV